jgi:hypothetical protein
VTQDLAVRVDDGIDAEDVAECLAAADDRIALWTERRRSGKPFPLRRAME